MVKRRAAADGRACRLIYVGDFDASGEDVQRDFAARTDCWESVERVALTFDQVRDYRIAPAEGKAADPRWSGFAARYGFERDRPVQWEVELEPQIDRAALARQLQLEDEARREIAALLTRQPGG